MVMQAPRTTPTNRTTNMIRIHLHGVGTRWKNFSQNEIGHGGSCCHAVCHKAAGRPVELKQRCVTRSVQRQSEGPITSPSNRQRCATQSTWLVLLVLCVPAVCDDAPSRGHVALVFCVHPLNLRANWSGGGVAVQGFKR